MRRVLVVDDDRLNVDFLNELLSKEGYSIQTATDGDGALHRIKAWKPQLLLLDVNLPGISGIDLIPKIRQATQDDYVSIMLVTANASLDDLLYGIEAGADDFLAKPFRAQELLVRMKTLLRYKDTQDALRRANQRIEEISSTDELTGLMNMRTLHRRGEDEIHRTRRFKKPASALLINLDRFSDINHEHGFTVGSAVLEEVGKRIRGCLRSIDMVARVGADEFFVFLVETDLANAEFMAERIRDALQTQPYKDARNSIPLSACIGVAGLNPDQANHQISDLFHFASEALRSAKSTGPNHIEIYSFA